MALQHVNWEVVLEKIVDDISNSLDLDLFLDTDIVREINALTQKSINDYPMNTNPNVAKIAGILAFWIRKLKPVSHTPKSHNKYSAINEKVSLDVGLAICANYFEDGINPHAKPSSRVYADWISSFRINSYSPHSTAIAFELLAEERQL